MSVNEKMKAIADAIRGKTGGTDSLTLDAMAAAIASIEAGGGGVETGEMVLNQFYRAPDMPLTIPVSAKHSHILIVPSVLSTFLINIPAAKYQYACYAAEGYGYIGVSVNSSISAAGTRGAGASYWEDETQTVFRADFTKTEIVLHPESYASFGYNGFSCVWFAW